MIVCDECGKQRRIRDGELLPCDHVITGRERVDWQRFKDACLRAWQKLRKSRE